MKLIQMRSKLNLL